MTKNIFHFLVKRISRGKNNCMDVTKVILIIEKNYKLFGKYRKNICLTGKTLSGNTS